MTERKLYVEMTDNEYEEYRKIKETSPEDRQKQIIDKINIGDFLFYKGFVRDGKVSMTKDVAYNTSSLETVFANAKENKKVYIIETIKD